MSSPAHVVSTLNRYVYLDSPNVAFLHRIGLQHEKVEGSDSPVLSIKLTFTFQHSPHAVFLRLHLPQSVSLTSAVPSSSSPSSADDGEWKINSIAASHVDVPVGDIQASVVRSSQLHYPLFRTVEGCIRVLRLFLLADASCRQHTQPWKSTPTAYIRRALLPASSDSTLPSPSASSPSSLLALDLVCSLVYSAMISSRSTSLVNPFPACFLKGSGVTESGGEDDLKETDDRLEDVRVDQKLITQQMPRLEAAFQLLPAITSIDFTAASAAPTPAPTPSPLAPLHSLPADVLALLSCLLSSHVRLTSVAVQPNLYAIGETEAHRQAAAISSHPSSTLTLPTYQFNLSHPPDPLFRANAARHSTFIAFHGSPLSNWHSILRRGLESKSGTKEQTSGALFGAGIYFSDDLRVARMFSGIGKGWGRSQLGDSLEVCGMYEVVNDPEGVRRYTEKERGEEAVPENYFVAVDNSYCKLKALLVWKAPKAEKVERKGMWMIAAYSLILLLIILSRVDWRYTSNAAARFMNQVR